MTILSILFNTRDKLSAKIGTFDMDVTIREQHQMAANVTTHPVESNSVISDHVFAEPKFVTIEGFVSTAPPNYFNAALEEAVRDPGNFSVAGQGPSRSRAVEAYKALTTLFENRSPLTLVTSLNTYNNMVIKSLSVPVERTIGFRFIAELQQVIIAKSKVTSIELKDDVKDSASQKSDRGKVQTQTPSASTTTLGRDLIDSLLR